MPRKKFTIDQIIRIIAESELPGNSNASVARKYGIAEQTLYRWKKKYKGLSKTEAQRLKVLEDENRRLKRLLAEKELEIQTLTEVIKKIFEQGGDDDNCEGIKRCRDEGEADRGVIFYFAFNIVL